MTSLSIICLVLVGVLSSGTQAQNWGGQAATNSIWGANANNAWNNNNAWINTNAWTRNNGLNNNNRFNNAAGGIWGLNQANLVRHYTCIGKNTNKDVMRVTLKTGQSDWRMLAWNQNPIEFEVSIQISGQSTTRGAYQLILTEFGRVEDGCYTQPLGRVMTSPRRQPFNMFFRAQNQQTDSGIIGQSFYLAPLNGAHWSGNLEGFNDINNLIGRGMAICQVGNVINRQCHFLIPLCCKIGYDSRSATTPVAQGGFNQMGGRVMNVMNQGAMGMNGMAGGMTGGMNGGMNGGMTGGMTGGMNGGMAGGMTGGVNTGGNPQTGTGTLGGLTFR